MNTQSSVRTRGEGASPAVKIGQSRQVVIPKKIHDALGLAAGDYLEVELAGGQVVMTPKTLVDKEVESRLNEAMDDVRAGRTRGPFSSAQTLTRALKARTKGKK